MVLDRCRRRVVSHMSDIEKTFEGHITYYNSPLHGISHLREVSSLAGRIAELNGIDVETAQIAGWLHDCGRKNDFPGRRHALDSAALARPLIAQYYPHLDIDLICDAIARHADGMTTHEPLAGTLWDADRLTLRRLGVPIMTRFLSTDAAKRLLRGGEY